MPSIGLIAFQGKGTTLKKPIETVAKQVKNVARISEVRSGRTAHATSPSPIYAVSQKQNPQDYCVFNEC